MVYLLYDLTLILAAFFLVPYYGVRGMRRGRVRQGLGERFARYSEEKLKAVAGKPVIWIHAVSVGETRAAEPLVKALREHYPDYALVVTNVTETGHGIAKTLSGVDLCLFFPFDFSWVIRKALRKLKPRLVMIVETEIWPNFVRLSRASGAPVLLVNGRISDRSFPRYRKVRRLLRPILERFSSLLMQSQADAERALDLGADPEKVSVTGNLKFDLNERIALLPPLSDLKAAYGLPADIAIVVAGSTHAGEEEILLDAFAGLGQAGLAACLVLVPRHPERCREVGELLKRRDVNYQLRSQLNSGEVLRSGDVLLGDTMGEMLGFYAAADLVFVGGSLVPVGGHNVLEAALMKKPVLFGPHMENFREISRLIQQCGGGLQVKAGTELVPAMCELIRSPARRKAMGEQGFALLQSNAGATSKTLQAVKALFEMGDGKA